MGGPCLVLLLLPGSHGLPSGFSWGSLQLHQGIYSEGDEGTDERASVDRWQGYITLHSIGGSVANEIERVCHGHAAMLPYPPRPYAGPLGPYKALKGLMRVLKGLVFPLRALCGSLKDL